MINIDTFTKSFKKELINNNDIIYIGMSSGISGTFGAANAAKNYLSKIFKDRQIQVIDSRGASLGEGMVVLEAAKLIAQGLSFNTIVNCVRKLLPNMCQIFTVDDLKYLKSTGRVSSAAAIVGSMLGIRPLLIGSDEGKIIMNGKVRGMTKALDAIADKYDKLVLEKRSPIGIAHADNEKAIGIADRLSDWYIKWAERMKTVNPFAVYKGEQAGMLGAWVDLYSLTDDEKYLELIELYKDNALFRRLMNEDDALSDDHANASIPLSHGAARMYELRSG